jgi:GxxExxY protein
MAVHRSLGPGFLESVYQDAMQIELAEQGIPFQRELQVPIFYKARMLGSPHRVDFLCFESVILELKALACLSGTEEAQVLHYLKGTRMAKGLLVNFGAPSLDYRRFINSSDFRRD